MMLFKTTMILCAVGLLAACQATPGNTLKSITGVNLGEGKFQAIQAQESAMSLTGDQSLVTSREAVNLPGRRIEHWRIKGGGSVVYEHLFSGVFSPDSNPHDTLIRMSRTVKRPGFGVNEDEIKWVLFQGDKLYYAYKKDEHVACISFVSNFGNVNGYADRTLRGGVCQILVKDTFTPDMKAAVLDLLQRMKFD